MSMRCCDDYLTRDEIHSAKKMNSVCKKITEDECHAVEMYMYEADSIGRYTAVLAREISETGNPIALKMLEDSKRDTVRAITRYRLAQNIVIRKYFGADMEGKKFIFDFDRCEVFQC